MSVVVLVPQRFFVGLWQTISDMEFLHKVEAVVILDADGNRVFVKYYPVVLADLDGASPHKKSDSIDATTGVWATPEKQRSMEAGIHSKARDPKRGASADGDIMIYEGHTVLYFVEQELTFVVVGSGDENEMVLNAVLQCLIESLQQVLKVSTVDKRTILEKYELLLLVVDEMIDDGVILETSSSFIVGDVAPYEMESSTEGARKALSTINKYLKQNL
jgi:hypothetical protein